MNRFPGMMIRGTILGSALLAAFGFIVTAGAAPLPTVAPLQTPEAIMQKENLQVEQEFVDADSSAELQEVVTQDGDCLVSGSFPQEIIQWCNLIGNYAMKYELSPDLIAAVMLQESGGNPTAYSHSGAVGLMQVMPRDGLAASFICPNGPCFASRPTIEELQDPEFNIEYGIRMLAGLQNRFGNIRDALKSYGPKDVGYYYADKVLRIYENYKGQP